ncbi:unnamed protein product [Leptidea sinapis]|uniref:Uncharacterized protein n=1 Tax=Leptidea sinapis TaxID=189913 RepID=A0A5E4QJY0_9NEOP|nr:unnamed protein product [Leptidea sinapis]
MRRGAGADCRLQRARGRRLHGEDLDQRLGGLVMFGDLA